MVTATKERISTFIAVRDRHTSLSRLRKNIKKSAGGVMIEAAFVVPFVLLIMAIGVDFGRAIMAKQAAMHAARAAGRVLATSVDYAKSTPDTNDKSYEQQAKEAFDAAWPMSTRFEDFNIEVARPAKFDGNHIVLRTKVTGNISTTFLKLIGISTLPVESYNLQVYERESFATQDAIMSLEDIREANGSFAGGGDPESYCDQGGASCGDIPFVTDDLDF